MSYTYKLFSGSDEKLNNRIATAAKNFQNEGRDGYAIYRDGQLSIVQWEGSLPYPAESLDAAAKNHIAELERQEMESDQPAVARPTGQIVMTSEQLQQIIAEAVRAAKEG